MTCVGSFMLLTGELMSELVADINECAVDRHLCTRGQCRNTPGSFQCVCPNGYRYNADSSACEGK